MNGYYYPLHLHIFHLRDITRAFGSIYFLAISAVEVWREHRSIGMINGLGHNCQGRELSVDIKHGSKMRQSFAWQAEFLND